MRGAAVPRATVVCIFVYNRLRAARRVSLYFGTLDQVSRDRRDVVPTRFIKRRVDHTPDVTHYFHLVFGHLSPESRMRLPSIGCLRRCVNPDFYINLDEEQRSSNRYADLVRGIFASIIY